MRYRFENDTLILPKLIIENINASANHTGCRLKFGPDKQLYITTGDADRPVNAQDLKSLSGKILRLNDDGSIPADNPFTKNDTARKEIWTYGHRNTQGIDFQPGTGYLFNSEHGPSGGDEINQINKGQNYGWPVIHHRETKPDMVSPILEYTPSIGPSEVVFYNANTFPGLKENLLLASLRGESITRLILDKDKIIGQEVLLKQKYGRLRALTIGPDGYIYFSTSQIDPPEGSPKPGYDMLLRLRPSANSVKPYNSSATSNITITTTVKTTSANLYQQLCASCHGKNLEGTETAKSLRDSKWEYGSGKKDVIKNIRMGIIEKGMPAWEGALSQKEIEELAAYISAETKSK
jgi:glucose/arabinose dehydrogenase/cytochrome c553